MMTQGFFTVTLAQFESLAENTTAREKLEHYFLQADAFSKSYAVAFRMQQVLLEDATNREITEWSSGMSIKSSKQKLKYFCSEYEALGQQQLAWRSESLLVGGLEQRRSYSTKSPKRPPVKAETIERDPITGLRAEISDKQSFGLFAKEIDPYGLVLGGRDCTRGRNSNLDSIVKEWLTRFEFESEIEAKGLLRSTWKLVGSKSRRRQVVFDARCGYLPTICHVSLSDDKGKNFDSEVKTTWEKYKDNQWRQSKCVVTNHSGERVIEQTFYFAWVDPEDLELYLAEKNLNEIVKDSYSDWYKLFSNFIGKQQLEVR